MAYLNTGIGKGREGGYNGSFEHRDWEKQRGWIFLAVDFFTLVLSFLQQAIPSRTSLVCCSKRLLRVGGKCNSRLKQPENHRDASTGSLQPCTGDCGHAVSRI